MANGNKINVQDVTWSGSTGWSATNFLRGDGTFAAASGGTGASFTVSTNVIPKGSASTISDGTWAFSGTTLYPLTDSSNIGLSGTNRVNTIYLASNLDYRTNLIFKSAGTETLRISGKNLGLNSSGTTGYLTIGVDDTPLSSATYSITGITSPDRPIYIPTNNKMYVPDGGNLGLVYIIDCSASTFTTLNLFYDFQYTYNFTGVYNSIKNTLYVSVVDSDTGTINNILEIDCATETIIDVISGFTNSQSIDFNSNDNIVYVTDTQVDTISVIDCVTNTVTTGITINNPIYIQYNSVDNTLYVTYDTDDILGVIDCNTNTLTTTITGFTVGLYYMAYNPINNKIYAPVDSPFDRYLYVVDCNTNTISASIFLSQRIVQPIYDINKNVLYVTQTTDLISIIDGETDEVIREVYGTSVYGGFNTRDNALYFGDFSTDSVGVLNTNFNSNTSSLVITGFTNDRNSNSLEIINLDGDSILKVRNDRKLIYTDGNEANFRYLGSDSDGLATWGQVSVTSGVTGTLPIANGGTNTTTIGSSGRVIVSNGSLYSSTTVGVAGQILKSNGTSAPTWGSDVYVSAATTNNSTKRFLFVNTTGGTFTVTGLTDVFVSGGTFNVLSRSFSGISATSITAVTVTATSITGTTITAGTYLGLPTDVYVTGGTSISSAGTATFTNITGGSFSVTGLAQSLNISLNTIPKGTGTTLTNSTWGFTGNHIFPISNGSNIGASPSNYVGTIQLGGTLNFHTDLFITDISVGRMRVYAGTGEFGIGFTGNTVQARVHIVSSGTTSAGFGLKVFNSTASTSTFAVRNDNRIVYNDGNEASGKTLTSDANGVATWQFVNRVLTIDSSATPTINTDLYNSVSITGQSADITSMTTNLTGVPRDFDKLMFRIKDNGSARAITWGSKFTAMGVDLPTTTVASKILTVGFIYDIILAKWGCVASTQEV